MSRDMLFYIIICVFVSQDGQSASSILLVPAVSHSFRTCTWKPAKKQFGTSRLLLSFRRVILGRAVTGTATPIDLCADSVVRL